MLDAETIFGFTESVLKPKFDEPAATPDLHKELWELCTSEYKFVAAAAPRGHAKSTAVTHSYVLSSLLFREKQYVIIISDTEDQARDFLFDIKAELTENPYLINLFGISRFIKDSSTDFIMEMEDGHQFRVMGKGAEQKIRGRKWRGKRPDLIVCDDLENDEAVLTKERREKLRSWFFSAVVPALSKNGQIRVVGTILHLDSLLENLLNDSEWITKRYRAHNEDFSEILWPERFPKEELERIRRSYRNQGIPEKYSQEYLNFPVDVQNALFRKEDLLPMREEDHNKSLIYYAAGDLAIGQKESSDYTCFIIGAMDDEGYLYIVDMIHGRFDGQEIVQEMINIQLKYNPEIFLLETEKVDKAIGPFLETEMRRQNAFINIEKKAPTKDKVARARGISARVKQGGVFFDKENSWYDDLEADLMTVTSSGIKAKHDDRVDAFSWLGIAINEFYFAPTKEEIEDEEYEQEYNQHLFGIGRNPVTGY